MRVKQAFVMTVAFGVAALVARGLAFQGMDPDRVVPDGGIKVAGWQGKIDKQSVTQGRTINDSKVAQQGDTITFNVGPAAVYWNPANTATGDFTVSAKFVEPKYMSANSHDHPYRHFHWRPPDGHRQDEPRLLRRVR